MSENNINTDKTIENQNTTLANEMPIPHASENTFDIRSFNSYSQDPPKQSEEILPNQTPTPAPQSFASLQLDGSYYTPSLGQTPPAPAAFADSPENAARTLKKDIKKRFSYTSFCIIIIYFVMQFAAILGVGIYVAVSGVSEPGNSVYMILAAICVAAASFPTMLLLLSRKKTIIPEKKTLKFRKLPAYFCITFALMYGGAFIGNIFKTVISEILGAPSENLVENSLQGVPIWLVVIFVCIFPGIFEELIFRKLIIDKTRQFSTFGAVVFSGLTFGLFHGNFEQFFYATLIGIFFGYIYAKTGRIIYTIILHILINFFGSVVGLLIEDNTALMSIYGVVLLAIIIIGIIALIIEFVDNFKMLREDESIKKIGGSNVITSIFLNGGAITLLVIFALVFASSTLQNLGM